MLLLGNKEEENCYIIKYITFYQLSKKTNVSPCNTFSIHYTNLSFILVQHPCHTVRYIITETARNFVHSMSCLILNNSIASPAPPFHFLLLSPSLFHTYIHPRTRTHTHPSFVLHQTQWIPATAHLLLLLHFHEDILIYLDLK